jgi:hypothetical protein
MSSRLRNPSSKHRTKHSADGSYQSSKYGFNYINTRGALVDGALDPNIFD